MSKTKKDGLINRLDTYFMNLLEEAEGVTPEGEVSAEGAGPTIGFIDKLRLFDSGVKWVATKNKVDPDDDDDAFSRARDKLRGTGKRGGAASSSDINGHG